MMMMMWVKLVVRRKSKSTSTLCSDHQMSINMIIVNKMKNDIEEKTLKWLLCFWGMEDVLVLRDELAAQKEQKGWVWRPGEKRQKKSPVNIWQSMSQIVFHVLDIIYCHYTAYLASQSGREISNTQSRRQDPLLDDGGGWHDIQKCSFSFFLVEEIVIGNNSSGKQSPFYWLRSCQILFMIELTIFIAAADGCWLRYSRHRLEILLPFLAEFLHHMPHCSAESWAKDKHTYQRIKRKWQKAKS